MSSELERRLEGVFAEAPEPDPGAGEKALHRALRALQPVRRAAARAPHRRPRLRGGGRPARDRRRLARRRRRAARQLRREGEAAVRPTTQLMLPKGANGIAAIVDGRLSVVTTGGFRLQGRPASRGRSSPHALYVAAGIGNSLVALAPNGRKSLVASGRREGRRDRLGAGRLPDRVRRPRRTALRPARRSTGTELTTRSIDRSVRAVRPSWRADSLAFAYVGAGGQRDRLRLRRTRSTAWSRPLLPSRASCFRAGRQRRSSSRRPARSDSGRRTVAARSGRSARVVRRSSGGGARGPGHASSDPQLRAHAAGASTNFSRCPAASSVSTGGLVVTRAGDRILAGWREQDGQTGSSR